MSDPSQRKVDTRVVVETPEGVDFQFIIAGPGSRAYAWLVDMIFKVAIIVVVSVGLSILGAFGEVGEGVATGAILFAMFLLDWFYGSLFETLWNGQTPGKKSAGLRVVRTNGTPIDVTSAIGRNFLRIADMQPTIPIFFPIPSGFAAIVLFFYTFGMISMLMTRRLQRLGDLVFDTMVVDERREWISRAGGLTARVEALTRAECPRKFGVPERTLAVIERLFETDRIISEARREEIARPLSEALRKRLGYQDPAPDPRNPHTFFQTQGFRHTQFILRVLKTFAQDPTGAKSPARPDDRSNRTGTSRGPQVNLSGRRTVSDAEAMRLVAGGPGS